MTLSVPENDIYRIVDNSAGTVFRTVVSNTVMRVFRSEHLLASKLITDSVVATLAFNKNITPSCVDTFIACLRKRTNSFYGTVNSAYIPVEDRFIEYAKSVLDDYETVRKLDMRTVNFIVYVIAVDVSKNKNINRLELFSSAYSMEELKRNKILRYLTT